MAYADVSDLESRWRELNEAEQARAAVLLDDASAVLSELLGISEDEVEKGSEQERLLRMICCNMVQRAMSSSADAYGVTQSTVSADIYSQTFLYSNPTGDLYLTKLEKKLLGISTSGYIGTIPPKIGHVDD